MKMEIDDGGISMKPLCVIPARRNSKRLHQKNILSLAGYPMINHTIYAAIRSGVFDSVWVSTEDAEIATIAKEAGANVHPRPKNLAGDLVSSTDVCLELAEALALQGKLTDAIVCLQPTSPLRNSDDIRDSWNQFVDTKTDYLVSVTAVDPHYFHWVVHQNPYGWAMYFGDQFLKERLLLPPVYRPNGAIKIGRLASLRKSHNFFGSKLEVYEMPEDRSIHVGNLFDFELVEFLMQKRKG